MNSASAERAGISMAQIFALNDEREQMTRIQEIIKLESEGCVVRSLESAFDCPATLDEMRLRSGHLDQIRADAKTLHLDPQTDFGSRIIRQMDDKMFDRFVEEVCSHDTPLGMALRTHNFAHVSLNSEETERLLEEGSKLLLSLKTPGKSGHMSHVQIEDGKIVQVSDEYEEVTLDVSETYDGILITPK